LRGIYEELSDLFEGRPEGAESSPQWGGSPPFSNPISGILIFISALIICVSYIGSPFMTLRTSFYVYYTLLSLGLSRPFTFFLGLIQQRLRYTPFNLNTLKYIRFW
jgi:hypothetical protein